MFQQQLAITQQVNVLACSTCFEDLYPQGVFGVPSRCMHNSDIIPAIVPFLPCEMQDAIPEHVLLCE